MTSELCSESETLLCQQEIPQMQRQQSEFAISFLVCVCMYCTQCGLPKYFVNGTFKTVPRETASATEEPKRLPENPTQ